jgi:anti-sigma factor RsiW
VSEPTYITCRELIDFIADYREGTLPESSAREVRRHLDICPSCVEYLAGYEKTVALTTLVRTDAPAPTTMPPDLAKAILAARRR